MQSGTPSFFVAGIVQGSIAGKEIHSQAYREKIRSILRAQFPNSQLIDPLELHPNSVAYGPTKARRVFLEHIEVASQVDILICYLPEASMGTGMEMYEAHKRGRLVVTITPLSSNWAIRTLSDRVLPDLDAFARFVHSGGLGRLWKRKSGKTSSP
ncbi:MAG: hypothetical protein V3S39_05355 [Thermodesulfobacteriota bacterium]